MKKIQGAVHSSAMHSHALQYSSDGGNDRLAAWMYYFIYFCMLSTSCSCDYMVLLLRKCSASVSASLGEARKKPDGRNQPPNLTSKSAALGSIC